MVRACFCTADEHMSMHSHALSVGLRHECVRAQTFVFRTRAYDLASCVVAESPNQRADLNDFTLNVERHCSCLSPCPLASLAPFLPSFIPRLAFDGKSAVMKPKAAFVGVSSSTRRSLSSATSEPWPQSSCGREAEEFKDARENARENAREEKRTRELFRAKKDARERMRAKTEKAQKGRASEDAAEREGVQRG
eukprot:6192700-Pleurochrysis_carterae.AAC.1